MSKTPSPPGDYARIAAAIEFICQRVSSQPSLETIATQVALSPAHFQRLFSRWVGTSPKRFLQVLTVERAKLLLREAQTVLAASDALGLSSGSRLHDHFVQLQAVTPGEYSSGGAGLVLDYGVHASPFGEVFIAASTRGICALQFLDNDAGGEALAQLRNDWPRATLRSRPRICAALVKTVFGQRQALDRPLSLYVKGTNFQLNVWKALLRIPPGSIASYGQIACAIGRPAAARAVGAAVGANPVGFIIPCHRAIRQSGELGGYHWGETRKQALHVWESARQER